MIPDIQTLLIHYPHLTVGEYCKQFLGIDMVKETEPIKPEYETVRLISKINESIAIEQARANGYEKRPRIRNNNIRSTPEYGIDKKQFIYQKRYGDY
jgi:hypothetical protein